MVERTLVLIKPDAVKRALTGSIIKRLERTGLKIVGMKMVWVDKKFAKDHYYDVEERHGKKVFIALSEYLALGPVVAVVFEGVNSIENIRKLVGATEPKSALPGTIRGDYTHHSYAHADKAERAIANVIHASADAKDAKREIAMWFDKKEQHSYARLDEEFVF